METIKITQRGWPGHFICASKCKFRLNTLIEKGKRKVIVSTVGLMGDLNSPEEIGADRYFETFVFPSKGDVFNDADVFRQLSTHDNRWQITELHDNVELEANEMHQSMVDWVVHRLENDLPLSTYSGEII